MKVNSFPEKADRRDNFAKKDHQRGGRIVQRVQVGFVLVAGHPLFQSIVIGIGRITV